MSTFSFCTSSGVTTLPSGTTLTIVVCPSTWDLISSEPGETIVPPSRRLLMTRFIFRSMKEASGADSARVGAERAGRRRNSADGRAMAATSAAAPRQSRARLERIVRFSAAPAAWLRAGGASLFVSGLPMNGFFLNTALRVHGKRFDIPPEGEPGVGVVDQRRHQRVLRIMP